MLKVLRILINILLVFAICMGLSLLQIILFDITAAQSSDVQAIHVVSSENDKVGYFDSYGFWMKDIKTNFEQDAKYRVRNWINGEHSKWWKNGTKWLDCAIDFTVGLFKPIFVPIAQVNAVRTYYGYTINQFNSYLNGSWYKNSEAANNALYELYIILDEGYGEAYIIGTDTPISEWNYTGKLLDKEITEENRYFEYQRWIPNNKQLYNASWRLAKYNSGSYDTYFTKFIMEDDNGNRHIKTPIIVMYYQQVLSLIIAIIFICKYPINFIQYKYSGKRKKHVTEESV